MKNTFYLILSLVLIFSGCSSDSDSQPSEIEISTNWAAITTSQTRTIEINGYDNSGNPVDVDYEWSSSDNSVLTVSDGIMSPISPGVAMISAQYGDLSTEVCTVYVAEDWILYAGEDALHLITPENDRDLVIPGTEGASGPVLWTEDGILYVVQLEWSFSTIRYKSHNSNDSYWIVEDTVDEIHDININPEGGYFVNGYPRIYRLQNTNPIANWNGNFAYPDSQYYEREGVAFEDMHVDQENDRIIARVRLGAAPRVVFFDLDIQPQDTLANIAVNCPRFSPNGDRVAFGYLGRLWVSTGTTDYLEVLSEGEAIEGLSWAGDGNRVAMCVRNTINIRELWIGNVNSGTTTKLTNAATCDEYYSPQWID